MQPPLQVISVNLGTAKPIMADGRRFLSAIAKQPISGNVQVKPLGLVGDEQADLNIHGGLSKAVYAYPAQHYPYWAQRRIEQGVSLFEETLPYGFMGENLSLTGLSEHAVWVGDVLQFANCALRVTEPRQPCFKFVSIMGYEHAAKDMVQTSRSGFYLAVDTPGTLAAGEPFELIPGSRSLSIAQAVQAKRYKFVR